MKSVQTVTRYYNGSIGIVITERETTWEQEKFVVEFNNDGDTVSFDAKEFAELKRLLTEARLIP